MLLYPLLWACSKHDNLGSQTKEKEVIVLMSNYNFYETKTRNWDAALWSILSIGENKSRYTKGSGGKPQPMNNLKA